MADAISIEETNKIRVAIGLKPLPVPGAGPTFKEAKADGADSGEEDPGSTLESRQAASYDNWKKLQDEADAKAKREARNEAIKKARDAGRRFARLEGKGLGDADDDTEVDTRTWLLRQKKRQKKVEQARRLEQELAEREQAAEHTAADLAGVKVAHEVDDFADGGEQVLTLKDTTIDQNEEEGDELENAELKEREALTEKLDLKKKKPVYNPKDMDESGNSTILAQYDEEIEGKKKKQFTLGDRGAVTADGEASGQANGLMKPKVFSLDLDGDVAPTSDYLEAPEPKIRKPKKKKAKATRRREAEDDEIETPQDFDAMEVDSTIEAGTTAAKTNDTSSKKRAFEESAFLDDDDLQASLALQRREALKKRRKMKPEDIARELRNGGSATPGAMDTDEGGRAEEGGLVIDETTEFVGNLQKPTIPKGRARATSRQPAKAGSPDGMEVDRANSHVDSDEDEEDAAEDDQARIKREALEAAPEELTTTGLDDEYTLNQGVGSTLTLLNQRGLLKSEPGNDLNAKDRERQRFLAEKQRREAEAERRARLQRERDRASGKLDRMSAREKEAYAQHENKARDQYESRQMAEVFNREYKPSVEINYTDEFGRSMNAKEAFKHLSHQFHGKGSGKHKTEKRLKKIEDEKKRLARSALDASQSTGITSAAGATARKQRTAGVRLG